MDSDLYKPTTTIAITADGATIEQDFVIYAANEAAAIAHADIPARGTSWAIGTGTIYLNRISISEAQSIPGQASATAWMVHLTWEPAGNGGDNPQAGKASWRKSVRAISTHVDRVKVEADQIHYPNPGAKYTGTGVNVTQDGPQGVEIDESQIALTIDHWMTPTDCSASYQAAIEALHLTVNAATFTGPWGAWAAKSVRYMGAEISQIGNELIQVSHSFIYAKNVAALPIYLDSIAGNVAVDKNGHEYAWTRFKESVDPADTTKRQIMSLDVHVATFYPTGNFSGLALPTLWD